MSPCSLGVPPSLPKHLLPTGRCRISLAAGSTCRAAAPAFPSTERITGVTLPSGSALDPRKGYTLAVERPLAEGRGGYGVLADGENRGSVGGITDSLARHVVSLPQPFSAPDPAVEGRISGG